MKLKSIVSLGIILMGFAACSSPEKKAETESNNLQLGVWRMEMDLGGKSLPFNFTLDQKKGGYEMVISNADEKIVANEITLKGDSLFIQMPVFESVFELEIKDSARLSGVWINYYKGPDYQLAVEAKHGLAYRFSNKQEDFLKDIGGKYETSFEVGTEDEYPAIGLFSQSGNKLTGTFATETGDYRHLEGNYVNDSIFLSTFDGSHAFLFEGVNEDSVIKGIFWSGSHYKTDWIAVKNEDAVLRNPDSLTFIKEGYERFVFTLPDADGKMVSLDDEKFQNKVVIAQVMGSWCPNCLDETEYLTQLHKQYKERGLEVVALAFERTRSEEQAIKNLQRLKTKTGAEYDFLLGGWNRDAKATEVLPMLNHIMSYPTAIFIDKLGNVRKIHTGFYGPGTGEYYTEFTKETEALIEALLVETNP